MFNFPTQRTVAMVLVLTTCSSIYSANAQNDDRGDKRRGPPPEAFEACAELASGDSCEMVGRRGEDLLGTCIVPRDDDEALVCMPENAPERGEHHFPVG